MTRPAPEPARGEPAPEPLGGGGDRVAPAQFLRAMLDSFERLLRRPLVARTGNDAADAAALDDAPFVVVAHTGDPDPLLCYGNRAALALWEMTAGEFLGVPSRLTAEPLHREERQRLLERTARDGFVDDYRGVRVSKTGRRFLIERAIVWNVETADGVRWGQAATFDRWTPLAPSVAP